MKVILKEDVESLGKAGQVVNVSAGYARNYLIPGNMALEANTRNIKVLEREKASIEARVDKEHRQAEETAQRLQSLSVTIERKIGDQGKLFGSVTSRDIEEAFAAQGISLDRKSIVLEEPIKEAGEFEVKVKLYPKVVGNLNVRVVGES
ncbi:MAG: 50S ribosomal protein L9 [Syntrophales bacterium]|jgi:large subunit ribosomal protein L9|nr:50S ribosomal protein L9 [Syntrophales bacterium]MCK9527425.1 50S ribosomal protein L9 [Syntrophales bacterium]MDX9921527.1 50S ribosomal protein L9 [Syntrophales bacterium]